MSSNGMASRMSRSSTPMSRSVSISFTSVKDLIAMIRRFIDGWNDRCHPFTWTKTADDILDHCKPGQRTSFTRH
jgi:hypothetical protein